MRACVAGALVAVLCLCGTATAAGPRLVVKGSHLVDARSGKRFVPRGVNWPSFEYACYYGYAYSDGDGAKTTHPNSSQARLIASWHANTVRLPLNEACWLGVDGQPAFGDAAGYRAAVQTWVKTLNRAGLAVILDLHWSAPPGVGAEGQRAMPDERSPAFWSSVAGAFKSNRAVMFDLFNEPYTRYDDDGNLVFDLSWDCWASGGCSPPAVNDGEPVDGNTYTAVGMASLVEAVRSTGAKQPLMLAGRDYANDLAEWLDHRPADRQLVAGFHNYAGQACHTVSCWNRTIAPVARRVPVVTGEFGEKDCRATHMKRFMSWADKRDVGYLAWAWWVLRNKRCSQLSVLANTRGKPRAPLGTALKSHLDRLACKRARREHC